MTDGCSASHSPLSICPSILVMYLTPFMLCIFNSVYNFVNFVSSMFFNVYPGIWGLLLFRLVSLTGPARAIVVSSDHLYFEDKDLCCLVMTYRTCFEDRNFTSELSTLEMATIRVKFVDGSWSDGFCGVFCAIIDNIADLKLPLDADGEIKLRCEVISVGLEGLLRISIMACCINGDRVVENQCREDLKSHEVVFEPKQSGTSSNTELKVGSCGMEVTVS
ncbi:hypothetical protein VPH35_029862 [Triticum aestivum]